MVWFPVNARGRRACQIAATCAALAILPAWAGGGSFDEHDEVEADANAGPRFFGSVKDRGGTAIPDAKVTVTVGTAATIIVRTDDLGYFSIKGFDKSIDPDSVDFSCSAEGYAFFARTRQRTGSGADAPISVTCLVEKT